MNEFNKAKEIALHFLDYKMRTEKEIYYRLKKEDYNDEIIEEVICFLKEYNCINDKYYVEMFVREKSKLNPIGKNKILYELNNKGIKKEIVNTVLEELEFDEFMLIDKILNDKFDFNNLNNLKDEISYLEKNKIYNYLTRRGFNSSIILSELNRKHR